MGFIEFVHAPDGVHLFAPFTERRVDVDAGAGDADPERSEMFEHNVHVGGLAENAHVGQDAVIDQIMGAVSVAAIFFALEISPLRFFDFAGDGGNNDVALQADARALQGFQGVRVADERAFHVVDAEAVDESVFDDGVRLVARSGEEVFGAGVRRVHVAVEHEVLPPPVPSQRPTTLARASSTSCHVTSRPSEVRALRMYSAI